MPLSEHEQRMLEQIESALYEEDPKFVMHVSQGRSKIIGLFARNRLMVGGIMVIGLILLGMGIVLPKVGGIPIFSVLGFVIMILGGLLALRSGKSFFVSEQGYKIPRNGTHNGFSQRMEERFRRRYGSGY